MYITNINYNELVGVKTAADFLNKLTKNDLDVLDLKLPIEVDFMVSKIEGIDYSNKPSLEHWDKSGYIKVSRSDEKKIKSIDIWINPSESEKRRRFTLAHELGHLVYDVLPYKDDMTKGELIEETFNRDGRTNQQEIRANKFAAQLLMPVQLIKKEVNELADALRQEKKTMSFKGLIDTLSNKFNVSERAMEIRLKTLNIIR